MVKIIKRETIAKENFASGKVSRVNIFQGDRKFNKGTTTPALIGKGVNVKMGSENWVDSGGYIQLWDEIGKLQYGIQQKVNAAQSPSATELEALLGKLFIDITRRAQESPDLTGRIATEITDLGFAEVVNLRDIYKYRGEMQVISGNNDSVPLIEQATGTTETVEMVIRALGWKDSLRNMLYNRLHSLQKVNEAVSDAQTDMRNARTIGSIVGASFVASQQQAADTTSNATLDTRTYYTLQAAIEKIRQLKDTRTDRKIAVPSLSILCNSTDTWQLQRVVDGQLFGAGGKGTITTSNMSRLPVSEIIEYDQGINNGFDWGKKTLSYPGVTAGTCYLFVPREYFWVMTKRPLTLETGMGSVLQLSTEERAWYSVQTEFNRIFLGSSVATSPPAAGYGAIVEITLPS